MSNSVSSYFALGIHCQDSSGNDGTNVQVAAQAEEIAGLHASVKDNSNSASQLEHTMAELKMQVRIWTLTK